MINKQKRILFTAPYKKRYIWENLKWTFYDLKYAVQRMLYGFSDRDVWNLDDWFVSVLPPMLRELRDTNHGHPVFDDVKTEEDWNKVLTKMADHFEKAGKVSNAMDSDELSANLHKDEGMRMFQKYFYGLWD